MTVAAGDQHLHVNSVTDIHAPALRGAVADLLDNAQRLVPRDYRIGYRQHSRVLLIVTATDAAGFDT